MDFRRGLIAGIVCALIGLIGPPLVVAAFAVVHWWLNDTRAFDRQYDIALWKLRAFPLIVIIPMLLFFAGFTSYAPKRYVGFAKTLGILVVTSLPLAALLGVIGMAHPRYKSIEHPPMYFSEVLMLFIPMAAVSLIMLCCLNGVRSLSDELGHCTSEPTEPSHPPEPAVGPVSNRESSPPAG